MPKKKPTPKDLDEFKNRVALINRKIGMLKYELIMTIMNYREESDIAWDKFNRILHDMHIITYTQAWYAMLVYKMLIKTGITDAEIWGDLINARIGKARYYKLRDMMTLFKPDIICYHVRQWGLAKGMRKLEKLLEKNGEK